MAAQTEKVLRSVPDSVELDESFILRGNPDVNQQYFSLYKHRLQTLRPSLKQNIRQQWGENVKICNHISDCQKSARDNVVIIGTLFKDMKKKQNPLLELEQENTANLEASTTADDDHKTERSVSSLMGLHISNSDFLVLEDENSSIKLSGDCFKKHKLVTGLVMAIRGCINHKTGYFLSTDYLFCDLPPITAINTSPSSLCNDKYVALVSGLEMSEMESTHSANIELLFNYLSGYVGDTANSHDVSSSICRVLFVGNLISEEVPDEDENVFYDTAFKKNEEIKIRSMDSRLKQLDAWMAQLSATVNVDVMPGIDDPSDDLLPQQPFHRCLFPRSSNLSTFRRVSNPYCISIENRVFLGSAGQNFRDMMKHSQLNMIEAMELSLRARVIAPTAPDTLSCFPFKSYDPFVIDKQCPHVYFCGNNDAFRYKMIKRRQCRKEDAMDTEMDTESEPHVCLLQIPSFVKTKQIVLFNLNTMTPQLMQLGCV